jgi:hypothetical protein
MTPNVDAASGWCGFAFRAVLQDGSELQRASGNICGIGDSA